MQLTLKLLRYTDTADGAAQALIKLFRTEDKQVTDPTQARWTVAIMVCLTMTAVLGHLLPCRAQQVCRRSGMGDVFGFPAGFVDGP